MDSNQSGVATAEPDEDRKQKKDTAESIIGDYDWEPLETFERNLAPAAEKVTGQRDLDMGPVRSEWPDDGIVHLERGMVWAFGQHRFEAIAAPILLASFWAFVALSWWLTAFLADSIRGFSGILLSWIVFGAAVFVFRLLLLLLTEFAFSFMETMIAARGNLKQEGADYE